MTEAGGTILAVFAWCCFASIPAGILLLFFRRFKPVDDPLSDYAHGDVPAVPNDLKIRVHVQPNNGTGA